MSVIAAALKHMIAAGMPQEAILAAVAEMEAAIQPTRSKGAERQARYEERKRQKASEMTKSVRNDENDAAAPSPNEYISNPLPEPLDSSIELSPLSIFDRISIAERSIAILIALLDAELSALRPEHVVEAWNEMAGRKGLPKAKLTPERRRKLQSRIKQHSVEDFTEAIAAIERSQFLLGENERGWRADLDFLLQPKSFTRLIEGSYDGTAH